MKPPSRILRFAPLLALVLALSSAACRSAEAGDEHPDEPIVVRVQPEPPSASSLGPETSVRTLFRSPRLSAHAIEARGPIAAHYHARHEETVYVTAGRARMRLGSVWHELEAGDLIHIPRGVIHQVEVLGSVSAISLIAPPFDGEDRIFVEAGTAPAAASARATAREASATIRPWRAGFLFLPEAPLDWQRGRYRDS